MRLQQMLFVAFASTVLLIGCSKSEKLSLSDAQPVHQMSQLVLTSKIKPSSFTPKQRGSLFMDNLLLYKNNLNHVIQSMPIVVSFGIHSVFDAFQKTFSHSSHYSFLFSPELFYQKKKIMIRGENTVLNC